MIDAAERQATVKAAGDVDRILTGHRVDHQKDLLRVDGGADARQLGHQLVVDVQAAGGIDEHDVAAAMRRLGACVATDLDRIGAFRRRMHRHLDLGAESDQLLDGGGAVDVGRYQVGSAAALRLQVSGELRDGGRLAGSLQADQHHDHGGRRRQVELGGAVAHQVGELGADDLDEVLLRREAAEHLGAERLLAHPLGEVAHHLEVNVRLQQREANLAHGVLDVALGDLAVPAKALDGLFELVA